jgi:alcohol dehydrogenase (NADP+)
MHFPLGQGNSFDHVATWKRMEALPKTKTRFIGVSNHNPSQIDDLLRASTTPPKVVQIELHPYLPQSEFVAKLHGLNIAVMAYAPLANTNPHYNARTTKMLEHPLVGQIAQAKRCTPAQVVLAWNLKRGVAPIPKAVVVAHAKENLGAEECAAKLTAEDAARIEGITKGQSRQYRFNEGPCAMMQGRCWEGLARGN